MAEATLRNTGQTLARRGRWRMFAGDWASDQRAFKNVSWGKAMMWIFLLSDTFVFSCFLISYMTARMSTTVRATSGQPSRTLEPRSAGCRPPAKTE